MTGLPQRGEIITLVSDAIESGARQDRACAAICLSERTLQRWQHGARRCDQQPIKVQTPKNKLSTVEREHLLAAANSEEFGHLPPGPIVPSALAPLVRYVNLTLPAWAMRKFKRFKSHKIRASRFLQRLSTERPNLFAHCTLGLRGVFN